MKRLILQLCMVAGMAILLTTCKKNESPDPIGNRSLLAKVSQNGQTVMELFYDIDKRIMRTNHYFQGKLSTYTLYEYEATGLKESRRYDADSHALTYQSVFTTDNLGRVIKAENYSSSTDFEEISSVHELAYNGNGQLTSRSFQVNANTLYRLDFTYNTDGNLVKHEQTNLPGQTGERLRLQYQYTPSQRKMPAVWTDYITLLEMTGQESYLRELFMDDIHYTAWANSGKVESELQFQMSAHQFDTQGNVTRQLVTRKKSISL